MMASSIVLKTLIIVVLGVLSPFIFITEGTDLLINIKYQACLRTQLFNYGPYLDVVSCTCSPYFGGSSIGSDQAWGEQWWPGPANYQNSTLYSEILSYGLWCITVGPSGTSSSLDDYVHLIMSNCSFFSPPDNQKWNLYNGTIDLSGSQFQIQSAYSGKCIEVNFNMTSGFFDVYQMTCNGDPAQKFTRIQKS